MDVEEIDKLKINKRSLKIFYNLLILNINDGRRCGVRQLHVPKKIEFPPSLRLVHWDAYPRKLFRFCPKNLVTLNMEYSELEKVWEGTQVSYLCVLMGKEIFDIIKFEMR